MKLSKTIYRGLVIGIFLCSFAGPHGGVIPVFLLELIGLGGLLAELSFSEENILILGVILLAISSQLLIIVFGKRNMEIKKNKTVFFLALTSLNGLIITSAFMHDVDETSKILLYSSSIFFVFSGLSFFKLFKMKNIKHNNF